MIEAALRLAIAVILGVATTVLIVRVDIHSSRAADAVDLLLMPGALAALLVSPGGPHGSHPQGWAGAIVIGNAVFYGIVWLLLLKGVALLRRRLTSNAM